MPWLLDNKKRQIELDLFFSRTLNLCFGWCIKTIYSKMNHYKQVRVGGGFFAFRVLFHDFLQQKTVSGCSYKFKRGNLLFLRRDGHGQLNGTLRRCLLQTRSKVHLTSILVFLARTLFLRRGLLQFGHAALGSPDHGQQVQTALGTWGHILRLPRVSV